MPLRHDAKRTNRPMSITPSSAALNNNPSVPHASGRPCTDVSTGTRVLVPG